MSSEAIHFELTPSLSGAPDYPLTKVDAITGPSSERRISLGARLARTVLRSALQEYLTASAYLRSIGAQTPSTQYGGSRSMIYMQMLNNAQTVIELRNARADYKNRHANPAANHDEYGGILRIAAYRLRSIPVVGSLLEAKVREDDAMMAEAPFTYPNDCVRYTAAIDQLDDVI